MVSEVFIQPEFTIEFVIFIMTFFTLLLYLSLKLNAFIAMYSTILTIGVFIYVGLLNESFIIVYTLIIFNLMLILLSQLVNISEN